MATRVGAGSSAANGEQEDWTDTESESSYAGSAAGSAIERPACPYRNPQYYDQECSRFFDCPTHVVERSPPDDAARPQENNVAMGAVPDTSRQHDTNDGLSQQQQNMGSNGRGSGSDSTADAVSQETSRPVAAIPVVEASSSQGAGMTLLEALSAITVPSQNVQGQNSEEGARQSSLAPVNSRPSSSRSSLRGDAPVFSPAALPVLNPSSTPAPPLAQATPSRRGPSEISLPRWQPDSEVTNCSICRQGFSMITRKHHCRRCGRVVCANCSPHRITIPYQYIVRPPGDALTLRASGLWGEESGIADFSAQGGGERVRLCNPCVPDPNTTPPQIQNSPIPQYSSWPSAHQRSRSTTSGGTGYFGNAGASNYQPYFSPNGAQSRSRSATVNSNILPQGYAGRHYGQLPPSPFGPANTLSGYSASSRLRPEPGPPVQPRAALYNILHAASSSSAAVNDRPLPPPPQIAEEDECPVCHRELPSRNQPNFETVREEHVAACILQHSNYTAPSGTSGLGGTYGTPPPRIQRRTGMIPYLATEKDCSDSAECTVCLEEFEVGVPMARLECMCLFHRACIEAWFVNHPGRCPVHQHDSYGY